MTAWFKAQTDFLADPYIWLLAAPVIFGVVYIATSFFGERGE